ncbi:MAG: tetraacyldisaccharide 4'-kinase [Verrucomicrobia bacterium]|nr:tetraacyldisaccharide 4'-kinase [Verrucomicrobiota bacterium]
MNPLFPRLWQHRRGPFSPLFALCSFFYGLLVQGRNRLYDWGILREAQAGVPVISIGNLSVGGTGKTPIAACIAKELREHKRTAILSRGYGGTVERLRSPVEVSSGGGPLYPWAYCGDEPFLLASNLPGVHLFAGRDRIAAASMAVAKGAQVLVLDDGMQHRRLARDLEIVLIDGKMPLHGGGLLPFGTLREPLSGLRRADMVVVNHTGGKVPVELKEELQKYTKAKIVAASYKAVCLPGPLSLEGKRVAIFSAIAQPERFRQTVESLGAIIVKELVAPDHASIERGRLNAFFEGVDADLALCTEKDWVKLPMSETYLLPLHYVKIELQIEEGRAEWETLFQRYTKTNPSDFLGIF